VGHVSKINLFLRCDSKQVLKISCYFCDVHMHETSFKLPIKFDQTWYSKPYKILSSHCYLGLVLYILRVTLLKGTNEHLHIFLLL
jgi:hypothetical protein